MNAVVLLLGATAAAFAVVANVTGSWGAALWAAALSPVASLAAAYSAHTARSAGGENA